MLLASDRTIYPRSQLQRKKKGSTENDGEGVALCCRQDWLHNLQGPAQNEDAGPSFKKEEFQDRDSRALKQGWGLSGLRSLCDCTCHVSMKPVLATNSKATMREMRRLLSDHS